MKSKSINDERFALVKVNLKNKVVQDYFTNEIVMENIDKSIFKSGWDNKMLIKNNELLLVANNGTTINFHKKIGKEWKHFMGLGLGLFMPNLVALQWENAIDKCDYYDVNSRDRWGIGKKNKGKMWSDTKIVKMILKDKENRGENED
jgi:hypothetical protein